MSSHKIKMMRIENIHRRSNQSVLTPQQLQRVRAICVALSEVQNCTEAQAIDDFQGDTHPEREIKIWEDIVSSYQARTVGASLDKKQRVFNRLLKQSLSDNPILVQPLTYEQ